MARGTRTDPRQRKSVLVHLIVNLCMGRADKKPDRKGRELWSTKIQRNAHRGIAASATTWRRHLGNAPIVQPAIEKKRAKHSSCPGELPPSAPNSLSRDFSADGPFEKMATGIAGFAPGGGKACLSPAIGRFGGMPIAWAMGASPGPSLASGMLRKASRPVPEGVRRAIRSDRGCHRRRPGRIGPMDKFGFARSMPKKRPLARRFGTRKLLWGNQKRDAL